MMQSTSSILSAYDIILNAWSCTLGGRDTIYLSGPITTGLRMMEGDTSDAVHFKHVFEVNCQEIIAVANGLRKERAQTVIEPASLNVPGWHQADYHRLWRELIRRHVCEMVFMPGWEFSHGCAIEFSQAVSSGLRMQTVSGSSISREDGLNALREAVSALRRHDNQAQALPLADKIDAVIHELLPSKVDVKPASDGLRKDASLDKLAQRGLNVAQFVSFEPQNGSPKQTFSRIADHSPNEHFSSLESALECLLAASSDQAINVRSYEPHNPQSREFIYGLKTVADASAAVSRLTSEGLHTIVNETIDVSDGGVSGVLMGDIIEFSPDDTPRCVEKPGTASLPRTLGKQLLATVYGVSIDLPVPIASRVEFSVHPKPRGWMQKNITTWEYADVPYANSRVKISWPNNFSRLIGDKAYGLLIGHLLGLPVPQTTVISRRVAPFSFGRPTGAGEHWIRTAPNEQMPGKFSTYRGWHDPFKLMQTEDETGKSISSVLSQDGVFPSYSGALISTDDGEPLIEGKKGAGDSFMLGEAGPEEIPAVVLRDVRALYEKAFAALGPVRFEWVHDGQCVWVVQLHSGGTHTTSHCLVPGEAKCWIDFDVKKGLEALRHQVADMKPNEGLTLIGKVGLTSHIADVIRKSGIPTRMKSDIS